MVILYEVGLVLALLIGGLLGLVLTASHYEQTAARQREYEKEIAEGRELYAALAMFRRVRTRRASDDKASAAWTPDPGVPAPPDTAVTAGTSGRAAGR